MFHKKRDCCPPPTLLSPLQLFSISPIQDQTEIRHSDTNEVTEAESQAVLNTLTVHDFQDAFKEWKKCWE
jgi:hypothetical protein